MYGNSWKEVSPSFSGPWKGVPKIHFRCEADVRGASFSQLLFLLFILIRLNIKTEYLV